MVKSSGASTNATIAALVNLAPAINQENMNQDEAEDDLKAQLQNPESELNQGSDPGLQEVVLELSSSSSADTRTQWKQLIPNGTWASALATVLGLKWTLACKITWLA